MGVMALMSEKEIVSLLYCHITSQSISFREIHGIPFLDYATKFLSTVIRTLNPFLVYQTKGVISLSV